MDDSSPQTRTQSEEIAGLVERVTFFNEESGFAVLRAKVRGQRDLTRAKKVLGVIGA
jgi:exodeoxyribonuclease V alpha subunit